MLGPFLFVIYINDLPDCLENECKMYADDNKVLAVNKPGIDNKLQLDINSTVRWCKTWSMTLNGQKCKVMHCGKKNPRNKYYIEDDDGNKMELETTEVEKDLGIMITADGRCSA